MALVAKAYTTSGTTLLHTGPVQLGGLSVANVTANPATVTVYNSLTATGTPIYSETFAANSEAVRTFPFPIYAGTGATLTITGTTPNVVGSAFLE